MSKDALRNLIKKISPIEAGRTYNKGDNTPFQRSIDGGSRAYRKQVLDKNAQIFSLGSAIEVAQELKLEILASQADLYDNKVITDSDLLEAARLLISTFDSGAINAKQGEDLYIYNSYDAMQKNLAKANKIAYAFLVDKIIKAGKSLDTKVDDKGEISPLFDVNITSPDHTYSNVEVRFSEVFTRGLKFPLATIKKLGQYGGLAKDTELGFRSEFVKIRSYYSGTNKIFDVSVGAQVKLRSKKDNEAAGRNQSLAIAKELKEAVEKAIANNNWPDQDASDSYVKYIEKTLNNAVINSGGTGSRKTIDKNSNSVESKASSTIPIYTRAKTKDKPTRLVPTTPKAKASKYSLQSIVNFINIKLPPILKENMGPGAPLRTKTGRFADSARILSATINPSGNPTLNYTYQRSPYDVFDKTSGRKPWNIPGRDPSELIQRTIREIASELAIGRFYLRRV